MWRPRVGPERYLCLAVSAAVSVGSDWGVFDRLVLVQRGIQAIAALGTQDMQRVTQVKGVAVGVGALIRRRNRLKAAVVIALSLTGVGEVSHQVSSASA